MNIRIQFHVPADAVAFALAAAATPLAPVTAQIVPFGCPTEPGPFGSMLHPAV